MKQCTLVEKVVTINFLNKVPPRELAPVIYAHTAEKYVYDHHAGYFTDTIKQYLKYFKQFTFTHFLQISNSNTLLTKLHIILTILQKTTTLINL